jgi:phosphoglycerate dehydrogenase-like enzyme
VDAIRRAAFRAAARGHPDLAGRLSVSFGKDAAELETGLGQAEVLVAGHFAAHDLARRAPALRWIQSTSAGVEKLAPVLPPGVILTNASGVHGPKGAEYALTALLMLHHRVPRFVTGQRARRWEPVYSDRIGGKTLVVLGVGRIGGAAARLARRLGLRVLGVRRSGAPHGAVDAMYRPRDLSRILPRADFVLVTAPLTAETRGLLGRRELDRLPRHAGLVNLGRAGVVDYDALRGKLERGELGGAVLDVFPEEPLPADSPWWTTPNVILSPHCAVDDLVEYVPRCLDIFFENMRRYLAGRPLRNRVEPARGY